MPLLEPLNSRDLKKINKFVKEHWGSELSKDYAYLMNNKNKIYIEYVTLDLSKLRIDSVGVYFGELYAEELRLSIEGSQILGPKATKNVIELSYEEMRDWLKGNELNKQTDCEGFVIIKHKKDYCGCGKVTTEVIKNYVPKARRILCSD